MTVNIVHLHAIQTSTPWENWAYGPEVPLNFLKIEKAEPKAEPKDRRSSCCAIGSAIGYTNRYNKEQGIKPYRLPINTQWRNCGFRLWSGRISNQTFIPECVLLVLFQVSDVASG